MSPSPSQAQAQTSLTSFNQLTSAFFRHSNGIAFYHCVNIKSRLTPIAPSHTNENLSLRLINLHQVLQHPAYLHKTHLYLTRPNHHNLQNLGYELNRSLMLSAFFQRLNRLPNQTLISNQIKRHGPSQCIPRYSSCSASN
jgi:hypothetical protein